ncbi:TSUP family transporter [Pseudoalteromonas xiamenensis]|uniref:TSUP family transporter n=1 Tax=Pseudoalteromonas xiamenensis TaxID=882626 RepID=UPI0027E444D4|nr:TSUP family transporter [Pseudoalteromonas xiamenensis]WMN61389.1 TSUP family transporter [Pseudoalteromonas xiamenensis]
MDLFFGYEIWVVVTLVFVALCAGYIDAIAGGGGVLQVPALLLCGVSPISSLATNKVVSMVGTSFVVLKYSLNKLIKWRYVALAIIPCFLGSILGSKLAILAPDWFLEGLILTSIVIALVFTRLVKTDHHVENQPQSKPKFVSLLTGIGVYDGLAGPGTGSFMVLATNKSLRYDLLVSTAIAKPINLTTNVAATLVFVFAGKVVWPIAIPMLIANSIGGWIGGHAAVAKGAGFVKKILSFVLIAMLSANVGKLVFNF